MSKNIDEKEENVRLEFQSWLSQWNDIPWAKNKDHDIYRNLFYVYKFVNNHIGLEVFLSEHKWTIERWWEVDYLIRDIELTDKILLRLPVKVRRNLLAAIQNYSRGELKRNLNKSQSLMTYTFDYTKKREPKEKTLLYLSKLLDAPYWYIRNDHTDMDSRGYEEFMDENAISFNSLINEINDVAPDTIKFFKVKTSQEYFINPKRDYLFVRVLSFYNFKAIEVMELNYETDEKLDFINYGIRDHHVRCIIVTPALLRKTKKVIYVLRSCDGEDSVEMMKYISQMEKRKFTYIYKFKDESNYYTKV